MPRGVGAPSLLALTGLVVEAGIRSCAEGRATLCGGGTQIALGKGVAGGDGRSPCLGGGDGGEVGVQEHEQGLVEPFRGDRPASLARWMAPVASESISAARPSSSAPTAVAMSQLLVM